MNLYLGTCTAVYWYHYVMIVPERTMARLAARLEAARRADYTLHAAIAAYTLRL